MLKIISEEVIVLNAEADTWQEAIRKAAEPLVESGYIKDGYINGIIENVESSGPYIVIAPHVAIPHARPNDQVLKNCIGICTLKKPVEFGNKANDPVKYLFCLVAVDDDAHLASLSELALLLEDEEFYKMLSCAQNKTEVIEYLKGKEE